MPLFCFRANLWKICPSDRREKITSRATKSKGADTCGS